LEDISILHERTAASPYSRAIIQRLFTCNAGKSAKKTAKKPTKRLYPFPLVRPMEKRSNGGSWL
jgi:hypothetical protein